MQHNIRSVAARLHCNRGCHGCSPAAATIVAGVPGEQFATIDKALDARTIGHNPERLSLLQGGIVYANQVLYCVFSHKAVPTMVWCLTSHSDLTFRLQLHLRSALHSSSLLRTGTGFLLRYQHPTEARLARAAGDDGVADLCGGRTRRRRRGAA